VRVVRASIHAIPTFEGTTTEIGRWKSTGGTGMVLLSLDVHEI
jgi:hypothetical protein